MNRKSLQFDEFPTSVRKGIIFLFVAWGWCILTQTLMFKQIPIAQAVIGGLICFFVFRIAHWARIFNMIIILTSSYVAFTALYYGLPTIGLLAGANAIFFSISTYYLMKKESSAFFRNNKSILSKQIDSHQKCLQDLRNIEMEIVRDSVSNQGQVEAIGKLVVSKAGRITIDVNDQELSESCENAFSIRHTQEIGGMTEELAFWDGIMMVDQEVPCSIVESFYYGNSCGVLSPETRKIVGDILKKHGLLLY